MKKKCDRIDIPVGNKEIDRFMEININLIKELNNSYDFIIDNEYLLKCFDEIALLIMDLLHNINYYKDKNDNDPLCDLIHMMYDRISNNLLDKLVKMRGDKKDGKSRKRSNCNK